MSLRSAIDNSILAIEHALSTLMGLNDAFTDTDLANSANVVSDVETVANVVVAVADVVSDVKKL